MATANPLTKGEMSVTGLSLRLASISALSGSSTSVPAPVSTSAPRCFSSGMGKASGSLSVEAIKLPIDGLVSGVLPPDPTVKVDRLAMPLDPYLPSTGVVEYSSVSSCQRKATSEFSIAWADGTTFWTESAQTTKTPSSRTNAAYWFFLADAIPSIVSSTWQSQ